MHPHVIPAKATLDNGVALTPRCAPLFCDHLGGRGGASPFNVRSA
jgi:hypothetical protein